MNETIYNHKLSLDTLGDETVLRTARELADSLGISYAGALDLIKLARQLGQAKAVGKRKIPRGKYQILWQLPVSLTLSLKENHGQVGYQV